MMLWSDFRTGVRAWMGTPLPAVVIVMTLAIGVGLNTAIFSVVHAVLLRPLPYRDPESLVSVSVTNRKTGSRDKVSGADLVDWQARSTAVQDFAAYWDVSFTVPGDVPLTLPSWEVSGNLFNMLGTPALLGRTLGPEDSRPDKPPVAVLSHRLWVERFGASPNVIGKQLSLQRSDGVDPSEATYEVVGVMPAEFAHPSPTAALWTPLRADLSQNRHQPVFQVIARLRTDVSLARADAELKGIAAVLAREYPDTNATRTVTVRDIREIYAGDVKASLWVLQGAALVLLFIACTNIVSLFLARAIARGRHIAIRSAIGATGPQLFRQALVEAFVVTASGSVVGLVLAFAAVQVLPRLLRNQLTNVRLPEGSVGWMTPGVVGAVIVVTCLIWLVLAIAAAGRSARGTALVSDSSRTSSAPRWALRARAAFIVGQVALSLCLLIAAGLLVRSFARLQDRALGFRTENIVSGVFVFPSDRYSNATQRELFLEQLILRLQSLPQVRDAAVMSTLPLTGADARRPYRLPGAPRREDQWTQYRVVSSRYFDVMDIPLRRGRFFDDRDRDGAEEVAIVNEALARTLWPGEDPIGKKILVADTAPPAQEREIVGVVGDVRHNGPGSDVPLEFYRPASQTSWPFFSLVVRTAGDPRRVIPSVRAAVGSLDRTIALGPSLRPFEELAAGAVSMQRASTTLMSVFAIVAVILAVVGAYGLVSYVTAQRTREFGIRMAFGARTGDIYGAVLRYGLPPVLLGVAIGMVAALASTRLLQSILFQVTPRDPATFTITSISFTAIGALAMLIPARRAASLDPVSALRQD
jgi:putative ABC transport system permease protein